MNNMNNKYMEFVAYRMVHFFLTRSAEQSTGEPPSKEEINAYEKEFAKIRETNKDILLYIQKHFNGELTDEFLHEIHRIAVRNDVIEEKGEYKKAENFVFNIYQKYDETANPEDVPRLMKEWIDKQNEFIKKETSDDEALKMISRSLIDFFEIHPYRNGNGKVGRALVVYLGLKKGLYPVIIPKQQRDEYAILVANKDAEGLYFLLKKNQKEEEKVWNELNNPITRKREQI